MRVFPLEQWPRHLERVYQKPFSIWPRTDNPSLWTENLKVWRVESATTHGTEYHVVWERYDDEEFIRCSCPGNYTFGRPCKHCAQAVAQIHRRTMNKLLREKLALRPGKRPGERERNAL